MQIGTFGPITKNNHIDCGESFSCDCQTRKDFRVQSKHPQLFSKLSVKSASRVVFEFLPYTAKKRAHLWSQISDPRPILWTSWGEQWVLFVCHRCKWGGRRRLWKCRTLFACIATSVLPEAQCRNCENLLSPFFCKNYVKSTISLTTKLFLRNIFYVRVNFSFFHIVEWVPLSSVFFLSAY